MIVLVVGFNRPHYYQKCIEAVAANKPKRVIVSVDGGERSTQQAYKDLTPPAYEFIAHPENLGIAHHLFEMRDLCFAQDDRLLVIEDDVVVAPNYVQFIEGMLDWSERYDDVGAVTGWCPCWMTREEKEAKKTIVNMRNTNWITYGMKRRCWFDIRDTMQEYLDKFIVKGQYRVRHHGAIRVWAREKFVVDETATENGFPRSPGDFWPPNLFKAEVFPSSQDGALVGAFHLNGWKKVNTVVNRCVYIGAVGEHGTPLHYKNRRFGEMTIDVLEETGEFNVARNRTGEEETK